VKTFLPKSAGGFDSVRLHIMKDLLAETVGDATELEMAIWYFMVVVLRRGYRKLHGLCNSVFLSSH